MEDSGITESEYLTGSLDEEVALVAAFKNLTKSFAGSSNSPVKVPTLR